MRPFALPVYRSFCFAARSHCPSNTDRFRALYIILLSFFVGVKMSDGFFSEN